MSFVESGINPQYLVLHFVFSYNELGMWTKLLDKLV